MNNILYPLAILLFVSLNGCSFSPHLGGNDIKLKRYSVIKAQKASGNTYVHWDMRGEFVSTVNGVATLRYTIIWKNGKSSIKTLKNIKISSSAVEASVRFSFPILQNSEKYRFRQVSIEAQDKNEQWIILLRSRHPMGVELTLQIHSVNKTDIIAHRYYSQPAPSSKMPRVIKGISGRDNPELIPLRYSYGSFFSILTDENVEETWQLIHYNIPSITHEEMLALRKFALAYLEKLKQIQARDTLCNKVRWAFINKMTLTNGEIINIKSAKKRVLEEHFSQAKFALEKHFRPDIVKDIAHFIAKKITPGIGYSEIENVSLKDHSPNSYFSLYRDELCYQ